MCHDTGWVCVIGVVGGMDRVFRFAPNFADMSPVVVCVFSHQAVNVCSSVWYPNHARNTNPRFVFGRKNRKTGNNRDVTDLKLKGINFEPIPRMDPAAVY